jgi:hypothetical protein
LAVSTASAAASSWHADASLIRAANAELLLVLIAAVWLVARLQPGWHRLAQHLKSRAKSSTVVITVVVNRFAR